MSVWDWLSSASDAIKHKTPDISPVTEVCRKSYNVSRTATANVSRAVTTKARDVHACLSDEQVTRVAKNLSFNGALYFVRSYGGGPIIDIVSRSLHDGKVDSQKERLKDLEAKVAKLEKELMSSKKLSEHSEIQPITMASKSQAEPDQSTSASVNEKPEDVLRNFMLQHFVGTNIFDNLIIPVAGQSQKDNLASRTVGNSE